MNNGKKEYSIVINGIKEDIKQIKSLETALFELESKINEVNEKGGATVSVSAKKKAALSEEEKAEQKLAATIDKAVRARTDTNKAQIEAQIASQKIQKEVTREIQKNQLAEGSVKRLGMELNDLRNKYYELSDAERKNIDVGGAMLQRIQQMDAEYKTAKESAGQFQDNVGNYGSALTGLTKLNKGLDNISKTSQGLAQGLVGSMAFMSLFGEQSEENAEKTAKLQKVLMALSMVQGFNNNTLKTGITLKQEDAAATTAQATATTVAATATNVSTKALKIFRVALISTGIGAVVVLLGALIANFDKVSDFILKLIPGLTNLSAGFDKLKATIAGIGNAIINYMLTPIRAVISFFDEWRKNGIKAVFGAAGNEIKKGFNVVENYQKGFDKQSERNAANAAKRRKKERAKELDEIIKDNEAKAGSDWKYTDDGVKAYREFYELKKQIAKEGSKDLKELQREEWQFEADLKKKAEDDAKARAAAELTALRQVEDERIKLISSSYEKQRRTISNSYKRQIEDLEKQLVEEKNLTKKARENIDETILLLQKQQNKELDELNKLRVKELEQLDLEIDAVRFNLLQDSFDKRLSLIIVNSARELQELEKRLKETREMQDTAAGEDLDSLNAQEASILELIRLKTEERNKTVRDLNIDNLRKMSSDTLKAVEGTFKLANTAIGDLYAENDKGFIDVEATKVNFARADFALYEYVEGVKKYLAELEETNAGSLSQFEYDSAEYNAQLLANEIATAEATDKINKANKQRSENAKKAAQVEVTALVEVLNEINEYAQMFTDIAGGLADVFSEALHLQVDELNNELEVINEHYENARALREAAAADVENLEQRIQNATGGTATALKEQLQDSMAARDEAAREEERLAREKEKREKEIAKKEKQMKRAQLVSNMIMAIANTAQGATSALSQWGFPLGVVFAAIIGALGAAQVGIMAAQLNKLADGGEIIGNSHANGGVPIGLGYEAEGGEFVINKESYAANKGLVNFINDTPRTVTAADLVGAAATVPNANITEFNMDTAKILNAIDNIDLQPVVAVKDIIDVTDNLTTVTDLAGYGQF